MTAILTVTMNPSVDVSASTGKVVPVRKLRSTDVRRDPGGGGINVARVVKRLGGDCRALYPAGGTPGHLLHRLLDQEGILSIPIDVAADTRESLTILDEGNGDQYRFVLPGAPLSAHEWQACLDRVTALADPPHYIVASGSLPPAVPDDFYARLARIAASIGARIVLDTSGPALAAALEEGVHLVKPNLRELRDLTELPLDREPEWERAAAGLVGPARQTSSRSRSATRELYWSAAIPISARLQFPSASRAPSAQETASLPDWRGAFLRGQASKTRSATL